MFLIQIEPFFVITQYQNIISGIIILINEIYNLIQANKTLTQAIQIITEKLQHQCIIKLFDNQLNDLTPKVLIKQQQTVDPYFSPTIYTSRHSRSNENLPCNQSKQINIKSYKYHDANIQSGDSVRSSTQKDQTFKTITDLIKYYLNNKEFREQLLIAKEYDYKTGQKTKYKLIISLDVHNYIIVAFIKLDEVYLAKQQSQLIAFKQMIAQIFTHKLKTPLNATLGYLNSALDDLAISDQTKEIYLKPALLNSKLQVYQVQDLIDYLNCELQEITLQITKVNLYKLLYSLNELLEVQCQIKNISLKLFINNKEWIQYSQNQIYIQTDQQKLERILLNLLNNSYRYSPYNGEIQVDIQINETDQKAFIQVSDNGEGFNEEQINFMNDQALKQNNVHISHQFEKNHFQKNFKYGISLQITNKLIYSLSGQHSSLQLKSSTKGANFQFFISTNQQQQHKFSGSQKNIQSATKSQKLISHLEADNGSIYSRYNMRRILNFEPNQGFIRKNEIYKSQTCNITQLAYGCINIPAVDPIDFMYFPDIKNQYGFQICAIREQNNSFYFNIQKEFKCPSDYKMCGNQEDYFYCTQELECPILKIGLKGKVTLQNEIEGNKLKTQTLIYNRKGENQLPVVEFKVRESGVCFKNNERTITSGRRDYILMRENKTECAQDPRFEQILISDEVSYYSSNNQLKLQNQLRGYDISQVYQWGIFQRSYILWKMQCRGQELDTFMNMENSLNNILHNQLVLLIISVIFFLVLSIVFSIITFMNLKESNSSDGQNYIFSFEVIIKLILQSYQAYVIINSFQMINKGVNNFEQLNIKQCTDEYALGQLNIIKDSLQTQVYTFNYVQLIMFITTTILDLSIIIILIIIYCIQRISYYYINRNHNIHQNEQQQKSTDNNQNNGANEFQHY